MDHHEDGPSTMGRRLACSGSSDAERGLPDIDTEWSAEGTLMHAAVCDHSLRRDMSADQLEALEVCDAVIASMGPGHTCAEESVTIYSPDGWGGTLLTWGTLDYLHIAPDGPTATLVDWKFGYAPVARPDANEQLACYACGVLQRYPRLEYVDAILVQPRLRSENHPRFRFTDAAAIAAHVEAILERCKTDHTRTAGPHCAYCRARKTCPAWAAVEGALVTMPEASICAANVADTYAKIQIVRKRLDEIAGVCKDVVRAAGGEAPGVRMRVTQGRRECVNVPELRHAMSYTLTDEEFDALLSIPIGKLEDAYSRAAKESGLTATIKEGREFFSSLTDGLVARGAPSESLVLTAEED